MIALDVNEKFSGKEVVIMISVHMPNDEASQNYALRIMQYQIEYLIMPDSCYK